MMTKNPFPGMNPFFEQSWRGAHTLLIAYLNDALQERLPPDLIARPEEAVVTIGAGPGATAYYPDLQVREPQSLQEPSAAEAVGTPAPPRPTPPATEPHLL